MKIFGGITRIISAIFAAVSIIAISGACSRIEDCNESLIPLTVEASFLGTKVAYEDNGSTWITRKWSSGDTFIAIEDVNGDGSNVKVYTFTATGSGSNTTSFTANVTPPTEATKWTAVYGKKAGESGGTVTLSYAGQTGRLEDLQDCDYMVAISSGETPSFTFSTDLSYIIVATVPGDIKRIEFNAPAQTVNSSGTIQKVPAKTVAEDEIQTIENSGTTVYFAVPAVDYSEAGLIVTILNNDGSRSQGKVISRNFYDVAGKVGEYDFSSLTLIDRPTGNRNVTVGSYTTKDIVDLGERGKWAAFNVGATFSPSAPADVHGFYYQWGKIEQSYDSEGVLCYNWGTYRPILSSSGAWGTSGDKIHVWNGNVGNADIKGSKFDVARVKWGKDWRMPMQSELFNITGGGEWDGAPTINYGSETTVSVQGKNVIFNGQYFFVPYAGYRDKYSLIMNNNYGLLSSNGQGTKSALYASACPETMDPKTVGNNDRFYGQPIRAIYVGE